MSILGWFPVRVITRDDGNTIAEEELSDKPCPSFFDAHDMVVNDARAIIMPNDLRQQTLLEYAIKKYQMPEIKVGHSVTVTYKIRQAKVN